MTRLVTTFLLSLFFLFPGEHNHLYAHTDTNLINAVLAKVFEKSVKASLLKVDNRKTSISKDDASNTETDAINATELVDDDDDSISSRKYVEITNHNITFFYTQVSGPFCQYLKNRLPVCKHFSYTSSCKYILYRVIRI